MSSAPEWLPPILSLGGSWSGTVARLYGVFVNDFKRGKPHFEGRPVWWHRRVLEGSPYEEGFWHLITKTDPVTKERLPDFRRAERLPWCAPTIRNCRDLAVKVWDYEKGTGRVNTYVWLERMDYVVILQKRKHKRDYGEIAFLVTAFQIDGESSRKWFRRAYEQRCG